jgi:hypothetical protein
MLIHLVSELVTFSSIISLASLCWKLEECLYRQRDAAYAWTQQLNVVALTFHLRGPLYTVRLAGKGDNFFPISLMRVHLAVVAFLILLERVYRLDFLCLKVQLYQRKCIVDS